MMKRFLPALALVLALAGCRADKTRTLHVLTTNDVHGAFFSENYLGEQNPGSLYSVKALIDEIRKQYGRSRVLLLDAGDCLQGDNATYYFNYVDTLSEHLYPRIAKYMGYDAVTVGNHDVETSHKVYDRVTRQMEKEGVALLAGNALTPDGGSYWPEYKIFKKAGLKVLVMGYTNANIQEWLDPSIWSGMEFVSLVPFVQERVDALRREHEPDIVIVSVHSGTGAGDGKELESQGLDLFKSLKGVDLVVCAHDHRPIAIAENGIALVNSGSKAKNLGYAKITVGPNGEKTVEAKILPVDKDRIDEKMAEKFRPDYDKVREFTLREVGSISEDMRTRESFRGRCFYMDFLHYVQLTSSGADIAFAAPLSFDKQVAKGSVIYDDMFKIYPFENTLNVMRLSGKEILDYLEFSYGNWLSGESGHILNISERKDERYSRERWSFNYPSYNFDSASGIDYTVDITKPYGQRVKIASMADGSPFRLDKMYNVAMTSYRAAGGGNLILEGAGLSREELPERTVARYPEIRDLVYDYFVSAGEVTPEKLSGLGDWRFVPEKRANELLDKDMGLLFQ